MAAGLSGGRALSAGRTVRECLLSVPHRCRLYSKSAKPAQVHWAQRGLIKLTERFYDIEKLFIWSAAFQNWSLRKQNAYYGYTQSTHGVYIAAAYYILCQGGAVRFAGQEEWLRANQRGKFSWDFLNYKDVPLEAVDASGSSMTYDGMENLVCLKQLKYLNLRNCPYIDDWCLSRLHVFGDSLEELGLAGCPRVTERGLASLHHLKNLKRLDLSDLPGVDSRGLVRILLEESLPQCEIVGIEYEDGLLPEQDPAEQRPSSSNPNM